MAFGTVGLENLGGRLAVYIKRLPQGVHATKQAVSREVLTTVVNGTPVDTGKARSNWQVSGGGEVDDVLGPYAPGSHLGISESSNASGAISVGNAEIDAVAVGQDIYIQNNVEYIGLLNDGSSTQAPAGFVQQAIVQGVGEVEKQRVIE